MNLQQRTLFNCLLIAGLTAFTSRSFAQSASSFAQSTKLTAPPLPKNRWGVRVDLNGADPYPLLIIPGVTYQFGKHQLYGGIMLNVLDSRNFKTPFAGSNLMYQYYWSQRSHIFKAFAYFSNDIGKYSYDTKSGYVSFQDETLYPGTLHDKWLVISNLVGIGCDAHFGRHFYGSAMIGVGAAYRHHQSSFTFPDPAHEPNEETDSDWTYFKSTAEFRLSAGYRF
jgi:hypothetical protein